MTPTATTERIALTAEELKIAVEPIPTGRRFKQERADLGLGITELSVLCGCTRQQISRVENGLHAPSGTLLAQFTIAGADPQFILTGIRSNSISTLSLLFGKTLPMQDPLHLLGASLYLLNANAAHQEGLNPYPPSSSHHAGVETGWRMAHAAMSSDTTALPGTL